MQHAFLLLYIIISLLIVSLVLTGAEQLDATFCETVYQSNATLASAVSVAIASSTPVAIEATKGKNETDLKNWPQCAVSLLLSLAPLSYSVVFRRMAYGYFMMLTRRIYSKIVSLERACWISVERSKIVIVSATPAMR